MKRGLLYMICLLFVATSCLDEHRFGVVSSSKDEVKFSAELKRDAQTRTLYGADNQATNIKVKWVDGDKVMVFGTTCVPPASENQVGEYTIQISGENTPNNDNSGSKNMSVADNLVKIEEVGVRWGSAETSDFVAVYPSEGASFEYNETSKVVTASTTISATQNYVFNDQMVQKTATVKNANGTTTTKTINVWEGTHFANDATNPSMQNAIMYARTDDVKNGNPVSLSFEPFSTVLKFRFEGFDFSLATGAEAYYIQSITLKAPTGVNIAGDFDITIPRNADQSAENPVRATATGNNSNTITINTIKQGGSYLKIAANQAVEFNVFTLPLNGVTITGDETTSVDNLWTVTIKVQGVGDLTYKLLPVDGADDKAKTYTLVPGLIHKVKVPKMLANKVPEWNPENWITQIPPPVYVSELSVPGAWYCTNSGYQSTTDLATQYSKGIRAFNIDCRLTYQSGYSGNMVLCCAGSESSFLGGITSTGKTVLSALQEIAGLIPSNEYVVVVLTIAEKPKTDSNNTLGTVDPGQVLNAIAALLDNNGASLGVYGYTESTKGKTIGPDTVVEDVYDHMIVKVNANTIANAGTAEQGLNGVKGFVNYTTLPNTLLSYASMAPETNGDIVAGVFDEMQKAPIYWGKTAANLDFYYHQAQRTTYSGTYEVQEWSWSSMSYVTVTKPAEVEGVPTYEDRMTAIDDIIDKSKQIYDAGNHNAWFQIGIGGSRKNNEQDDDDASQLEVGERLNPYLYGKIVSKMDTDPSPVGVVLMNHCTSTSKKTATVDGKTYEASSDDLVKAIIEMNGKFYLNRRGNDIVTGDGEQNGANQSAVTKSCGNATIGFDAF